MCTLSVRNFAPGSADSFLDITTSFLNDLGGDDDAN